MNIKRAVLAVAGGAAVTALTFSPLPAGGQESSLPISVDPTSGPIGTTISVSGTDCAGDTVEIALLAGTGPESSTAVVDAVLAELAPDGSYAGELVVYDTMFDGLGQELPVVPGEAYVVVAACLFFPTDVPEAPTPDHWVLSAPVAFDVTGDGAAPPAEPPPSTVIADIEPAVAPAAAPVVARPTYTG